MPLEDILRIMDAEGGPTAGRRGTVWLPEEEVPIPPVSYGQVTQPDNIATQWPDAYSTRSYFSGPIKRFVLDDAIVHGEQGVVTIGDYVVRQSLYHVFLKPTGFVDVGDDMLELDEPEAAIEVADACYAMCGVVANINYAHWWIDVASVLQMPPFGADDHASVLVMPKLRRPYQMGSLELLPEAKSRAIFVGENTRVRCRRLIYFPDLVTSDPYPHPARRHLLAEVRRRAGAEAPTRRIYVSRKDAAKRRLENEDEIISILEAHDFEAVLLTGMRVDEQVRLFASATHVAGAHGAGLSNILFCHEGTRLLEFHMHDNLIWSIRRMAALSRMAYGCVFGATNHPDVHLDSRDWHVDPEVLRSALPGFIG